LKSAPFLQVDIYRRVCILPLNKEKFQKFFMKNIQTLFSAAVCGVALAFTAAAYAQDVKQGVATVVRVNGAASYTLGGNDGWHPLVAGKILQAGSAIKTEPDALVDVVLGKSVEMPQAQPTPDKITLAPDSPVRGLVGYKPLVEQNVIRLSGETTVKIDTLTISDTGVDTVSDTELDLQQGRIFYSVKKLSSESKYLIKIPNGIAGVRGSQGFVSADGTCGALVHNLYLSVVGSNGNATSITVEPGQQYNSGTGQISALPHDILDLLGQVSLAARTCYVETCSYAFNRNQFCFISPITGVKPIVGTIVIGPVFGGG
jgi:hypothetical protein